MTLQTGIKCPSCGIIIHIPFMKALKAKALEDYDMVEIDAQTQLKWLKHAPLWELFKFWWRKHNA